MRARWPLPPCLPALAFAATCAHATTFSTDVSDLWWNPGESGWGVNMIQQDNTLFATLFVYGPDGQPTWYVGSSLTSQGADGSGNLVFSGPWYRTQGPWYAGSFNPDSVIAHQVGTATFTLVSVNNAIFTYTVDTVSVTRSVTRQTWRSNNPAGSYLGGVAGSFTDCTNAANNTYQEDSAPVSVLTSGGGMAITMPWAGTTCSLSGDYSQAGRLGSSNGTYTCQNGRAGNYSLAEIEVGAGGFFARLSANETSCRYSGRLSTLRRGS